MSKFGGNSSVVEHHVANVRVASSNLVSRSIKIIVNSHLTIEQIKVAQRKVL